jgi:AraC-like DNA-binding protein
MKKARLMLKNFNITIARVATQCGYSSEAYFIKAFKKFYNTTPGEFRNKNLAE